jgi:hypothetical protein
MKSLLVVAAIAVAPASLDQSDFRWSRPLSVPAGSGPVAFDADAPLFAHAGPGFPGLRVVDARGDQVPWREFPPAAAPPPRTVQLLNAGRNNGAAVALIDLGPRRAVRDRIDLDVPATGFVGSVTVSGSDDRRTFTVLGTTRIFDVAGAFGSARSTAVTFPPSDFRYLRLRALGVPRIAGATVSGRSPAARMEVVSSKAHGRVLDLGGANVPVDLVRITATNARYDRSVQIEARNPGEPWRVIGDSRIFRYYGTPSPPIELATSARYLRVTIRNGDDPPLTGVRVEPLARPRTILVEGGHEEPLRLLYGGRPRGAPDYEFARLPRGVLGLADLRRGTLGPPALNAEFEAAPDRRSFFRKHPIVLDLALALAAAVLGLGAFLALRRA